MTDRVYNVLFLCTGNSARSVLAEALLNARGAGRFRAWSAGSHPVGRVNPHAIAVLEQAGLATDGLRSKSWDEFARPDAPSLDFIFTVCDSAANETCPLWPGQPVTAHWGLPDPAAVQGTEAEKARAFRDTFIALDRRIVVVGGEGRGGGGQGGDQGKDEHRQIQGFGGRTAGLRRRIAPAGNPPVGAHFPVRSSIGKILWTPRIEKNGMGGNAVLRFRKCPHRKRCGH